jgi:folylpolyglutamate synthase/dihydrofolate synthase
MGPIDNHVMSMMRATIDLTLERVFRLAARLPPYTRPTCHIAGTNGKGSVSAILHSILVESLRPLTVGRFNSPHLVSVHDSIVINQKPVTPELYSSVRAEVETADRDHAIGASSFELLTLTALLIFERSLVDIAVIEVGMGGRLDATNVIPDECILVSALSAVGMDHEAFLGRTVEAIATQKAGIARRGRPFIIGPQSYSEVEDAVKRVVASNGADLIRASAATKRTWDELVDGPRPSPSLSSPSRFRPPPPQPVRVKMPCFSSTVSSSLSLYGEHQLANLGLASTMVSTLLTHPWCTRTWPSNLRKLITPASVARGIKLAGWPGRLSFHTVTLSSTEQASRRLTSPLSILVDGAHNSSSSFALSGYLSKLLFCGHGESITLTYIIGLSHSPPKSPLQTLLPVLQLKLPPDVNVKINVAVLGFTRPEGMPWVNFVLPSELRQVVHSNNPDLDIWAAPDDGDPQQGHLHQALEWAESKQEPGSEGLVVLFGSLYLVADFYRLMRGGLLVDVEVE